MDEQLPVPAFVDWPIFPFVGDVKVRELADRLPHEYPRAGEPGNDPCHCETGARSVPIWQNERWTVREIRIDDRAAPFPAYMLEPVEHVDLGDLDDALAAEYGVLTVRLERAIVALGSVGRVHVLRWGDGGSHMHVWFLGRPAGAWQFSGFSLAMWLYIVPALDEAEIAANNASVAAAMG